MPLMFFTASYLPEIEWWNWSSSTRVHADYSMLDDGWLFLDSVYSVNGKVYYVDVQQAGQNFPAQSVTSAVGGKSAESLRSEASDGRGEIGGRQASVPVTNYFRKKSSLSQETSRTRLDCTKRVYIPCRPTDHTESSLVRVPVQPHLLFGSTRPNCTAQSHFRRPTPDRTAESTSSCTSSRHIHTNSSEPNGSAQVQE